MHTRETNLIMDSQAYISAIIKPITSKVDSDKDWSDIVRDKIVPYLENPFSHIQTQGREVVEPRGAYGVHDTAQ